MLLTQNAPCRLSLSSVVLLCVWTPLPPSSGNLLPQNQHTETSQNRAFVTIHPTASSVPRAKTLAGDAPLKSAPAGDGPRDVTPGPGRLWRGLPGVTDGGAAAGPSEARAVAAPADPVSFMMQSPDHSSNIVFYEAPEKEDSPCKTGGFSIFTLINFAIAAVNVANNILNNNNNNNNNNNDRNNNDNNINVADNNNNGNNLNMIDLGGALGRRRRLLVEHPGDLGAIQDSLHEDGLVLEVVGVHRPSGANNSAAAPNSASGRYKRDTLLNAWTWRAARRSDVPEVPDQLALLLRLTSDVSAVLPVQHALLMKHVMLLTLDLWEDFSSDELMSANQKMELKNCLLRERSGKSLG